MIWATSQGYVRAKAQGSIGGLLAHEVTELLGRGKSERPATVHAPVGYRNGHGKPRHLTLGSGTITVRRPRVRVLEERSRSRILPLSVRRSWEVNDLIPELYLHGLTESGLDLALSGLLGEGAAVSDGAAADDLVVHGMVSATFDLIFHDTVEWADDVARFAAWRDGKLVGVEQQLAPTSAPQGEGGT